MFRKEKMRWRQIIATAGNFSDGEEQAVPVLSNKQLVTESLALWQRGNSPATFDFTKLENSASPSWETSDSHLNTHPILHGLLCRLWPYMMEYPYQCSEQIFSRYYANAIATHVKNFHLVSKRYLIPGNLLLPAHSCLIWKPGVEDIVLWKKHHG